MLGNQEYAGTRAVSLKKAREVPGHRLEVVRYQNSILFSRLSQNFGIGNTFQSRLMRREKIKPTLTQPTTSHDGMAQTGIGEESNHWSVWPCRNLSTCPINLVSQFLRGGISFAELVLNALPLYQVFLNFFPVAQAERNRAMNLLKAQRRIKRANGLSGFAALKF